MTRTGRPVVMIAIAAIVTAAIVALVYWWTKPIVDPPRDPAGRRPETTSTSNAGPRKLVFAPHRTNYDEELTLLVAKRISAKEIRHAEATTSRLRVIYPRTADSGRGMNLDVLPPGDGRRFPRILGPVGLAL
jgi:hypothetical protein